MPNVVPVWGYHRNMASLLFVTNSLTGGGAERSTNLIANELFFRGHKVGVVPINSGPEDLVVLACSIFSVNRTWQSGPKETLRALRRFLKIIKQFQPDFIILNCDIPELFGLFVKGNHQIIVVEHSNKPWMNRPKLGRLVRKTYKFRNVLWISVRDSLKIWPDGLPPHKSITNPILDVKRIDAATNAEINYLKRLVFVGRLSVEKGIQNFLEIAKETKVSSIVIGDGPLRSNLIKEYQDLMEVAFMGQTKNPWDELTQNDLLIIPSLHEGDGLVVVEALSAGVPMLVSDIPEFRRFGLPERNYCRDTNQFIATIGSNKDNLADLIVPNEIVAPILSTRSIHSIADSWEIFLQTARY